MAVPHYWPISLANSLDFSQHYLGRNQTFSDHNVLLYLALKVRSAVRTRTWVIAFAVRARDGEGGTILRVVFLMDDDRRIKANLMSQQQSRPTACVRHGTNPTPP
jgi:hypothetical protein